ncbi:MAG TPA: hypothetical protein VNW15_04610 [Rhizomicrobium sp.]|jgi:hypothetical protein|nr:hypothetical protein [Rhizomicrobium sp.]
MGPKKVGKHHDSGNHAQEQGDTPKPPRSWFWNEDDPVARLTGYIACLTLVLAIVGVIQAWAFIQSERAFVFESLENITPFPLIHDQPLTVSISVQNAGRTEAEITGANFTYLVTDKALPPKPAYVNGGSNALPHEIAAGATYRGSFLPQAFDGKVRASFPQEAINKIISGEIQVYIFGWIKYRDTFSIFGSKETAFCGMFIPSNAAATQFNTCAEEAYLTRP